MSITNVDRSGGYISSLLQRIGLLFVSQTADVVPPSSTAALFHRSDTDKLRFLRGAGTATNLAEEDTLASTDNGKGASLVGVEDAGSLLSGATVEAALAELAKRANAGLAVPVCVPVVLVKHSNGSIAARFTPGYAGKIRKITASVTDPVSTGSKLATFTPYIGGTTVTGGALALTSANCATVGAKVDGSAITAANSFTSTDEITIVASSVTAFVEGQVVVYLFLDPAA